MRMKLLAGLEKKRETWFLIAASFVFFLLRLPSLFEPNWYGDEGIYQVIGFGLRHGRALYSGVWDNKPPLLYVLYGIFNGDQFATRLVSMLFGIGCIVLFFFIAKKLFKDPKPTMVATGLLTVLFGTPLIEGNIANAENFIMIFSLFAGLLVFSYSMLDKQARLHHLGRSSKLFFPGFLVGISFLFKVVGLFDFAAFFVFLFLIIYKNKQSLKEEFAALTSLTIGFGFPIVLTIVYFFLRGHLSVFIQSAFLSNVGYVGYGNKLIIPQGFLILKLLFLGGFLIFLFMKRSKLSTTQLFIFTWTAFSLFNAYFSQRPYTHYLLTLLPATILFTTFAIFEKQKKAFYLVLVVILLAVLLKSFSLYNKPFTYYTNFISFVTQEKSVSDYRRFFDWNTPRDYAISEYIMMNLKPNTHIFVWGNSGEIYRLTNTLPPGRYIVEYHMTSNATTMQETAKVLQQTQPNYIIDMDYNTPLPLSLKNYRENISVENVGIYERTF